MPVRTSLPLCRFLVLLLFAQPLLAFQTPLSDESLREAYFLGQRRDGSLEKLAESYSRHFTPPQTGPYISTIILATPFLIAAQSSSQQTANYSAQQAAADHRAGQETVQVAVEIQLTESYSQFLPVNPERHGSAPRSATPEGLVLRSGDFWKDFVIYLHNGESVLQPSTVDGRPNYRCNEHGGCTLTGATLRYDFRADAFASDSASITVEPPAGPSVTADFDLSRLR